MRVLMAAVTVLSAAVAGAAPRIAAQEKPLPKHEVRVQIPGCAYNRTFISGSAPAGEPVGSINEGRRFKMSAPKDLLAAISKQTPSMIEITGRIRRSDLDDARGIPLGGGVRIGGGRPQAPTSSVGRPDVGYNEVQIDVESFRLLPDSCPRR
jgi:hypothetical protein